jgi:hypothetical protein
MIRVTVTEEFELSEEWLLENGGGGGNGKDIDGRQLRLDDFTDDQLVGYTGYMGGKVLSSKVERGIF